MLILLFTMKGLGDEYDIEWAFAIAVAKKLAKTSLFKRFRDVIDAENMITNEDTYYSELEEPNTKRQHVDDPRYEPLPDDEEEEKAPAHGPENAPTTPPRAPPEEPNSTTEKDKKIHRRISSGPGGPPNDPDDDPDNRAFGSLFNNRREGNMPIFRGGLKNGGKNPVNDGEEVAVMPPPAKIAKVIPDYTTIRLPWHTFFTQESTPGSWNQTKTINLNSPANPSVDFVSHLPMGWTNWIANYEFYRVLECDVNIRWHYVHGIFPDAFNQLQVANKTSCYSLMVGYELTEDTAKKYGNALQMIEGKHSKVSWLEPKDAELYNDSQTEPVTETTNEHDLTALSVLTFGGYQEMDFHYDPSNWEYHVHEAGISERWTQNAAVSDNKHYLTIHTMTPGTNTITAPAGSTVFTRVDININYVVQFREAMESLFDRNTSSV